jgi:hypothetical protein
MTKLKGVYKTSKKNGEIYYKSSITYLGKHISLGSYNNQLNAHNAYIEAQNLLYSNKKIEDYEENYVIRFEKWVILINYRDSGHYIKNPIYLHKYYFSYYINRDTELIFDVDDLFYYSNHKIFKKNGYLFVNDYGMQINILSRFGIKNFAVVGKDYYFKDNDCTNLRYHNVVMINKFYGVERKIKNNKNLYISKININGYYKIGTYKTEIEAAIAYNKAVDFILANNILNKNYTKNYICEIDSKNYLVIYKSIKISDKILSLKTTP